MLDANDIYTLRLDVGDSGEGFILPDYAYQNADMRAVGDINLIRVYLLRWLVAHYATKVTTSDEKSKCHNDQLYTNYANMLRRAEIAAGISGGTLSVGSIDLQLGWKPLDPDYNN